MKEIAGPGPHILVGSSMGGWLALLLARDESQFVRGVVGIATAPDFTRWIYDGLTPVMKDRLETQGRIELPNAYSAEPYVLGKALFDDGEQHCLLDHETRFSMPLRLIQGMRDEDVPWQTPYRLKNAAPDSAIEIFLVEKGDHRLSRPEDLQLIDAQVRDLSGIK